MYFSWNQNNSLQKEKKSANIRKDNNAGKERVKKEGRK